MSDTEEGPPMVPTSHNSTPTTAASPTQAQAVQHLTSGPRDIRTQAFIADSDPDETGRRWKKWKNELLTATVLSVFPLSTLTEYCYCHCVISIPTQYSHWVLLLLPLCYQYSHSVLPLSIATATIYTLLIFIRLRTFYISMCYGNIFMYIQTFREVQGISFEIGSWTSMERITLADNAKVGVWNDENWCSVVWYFLC